MKAIKCTKYGPPEVLQVEDVEKPFPEDNEVLIKVHAAAVTVSDCIVRSGKINFLLWLPMRIFVGFGKPRKSIPGLELSGEIESIGRKVKRFKTGDQVMAFTGKNFGAYAEYICLPENGSFIPRDVVVVIKPANTSYEEAAAIPSRAGLALYYLRKGNIDRPEKINPASHENKKKVLIYGASGGVGTFAVQLAKYFGAEVTGVCSEKNLKLVKSIGADKVIDYNKDGAVQLLEQYDFIFDAVGKKKNSLLKKQYKNILSQNGKYISVDDGTPKIYVEDLVFIRELFEAGKLRTIIDKTYPLEQIVEAHRYVETGRKRGNVVITTGDKQ